MTATTEPPEPSARRGNARRPHGWPTARPRRCSPASPGSSTPVRPLRFVLVLGALIAIGPLTIDTYLPALPSITRDLGAPESASRPPSPASCSAWARAAAHRPAVRRGGSPQAAASPGWRCTSPRRSLRVAPTIELLTVGRVLQGLGNAAVGGRGHGHGPRLFAGSAAATLLVAPHARRAWRRSSRRPSGRHPAVHHLAWRLRRARGGRDDAGDAGVLRAARDVPPRAPSPGRRSAAVLRTYGGLLRDRTFVGLVLVAGLISPRCSPTSVGRRSSSRTSTA